MPELEFMPRERKTESSKLDKRKTKVISEIVPVRFSELELIRIEKAAKERMITVPQFIRETVCVALRK
jgi:hypothetical protein